jgi:hypothetical protein
LKKTVLDADEQAKLRAVNADPETQKSLKEYKAEGLIIKYSKLSTELMTTALEGAKNNKSVVLHEVFNEKK